MKKQTFSTLDAAKTALAELIKTEPTAYIAKGREDYYVIKTVKAHPATNSLGEPWGKPKMPAHLAAQTGG